MLALFKTITLNKNSELPLYIQLHDWLKKMIDCRTLIANYRLPSIRQLANTLNINTATVVSAYKMLENEKYIYKKLGSGTYVENISHTLKINSYNADAFDELYNQDDIFFENNHQITLSPNTINFASSSPTPDLFPIDDFKIVLNTVLDRDKGNAFQYHDIQGFYPLRESLISLLITKNIHVVPENIQIISGAQQGIDIISKTFLNQGDYVIVESPTYTGAIAVFKSRGAQIIELEIEEDGPDLNILEYLLKKYKPKLIYTIPSFQNPTGYSYSNFKRQKLIELADKYNSYIIEDDYISDLNYENLDIPTLKSIDKYDRVIFIKSFSKIFMPGLRLGFIIVPKILQENIGKAKHTSDISTSGLLQRAFDLYIRMGYWNKHLNFMFDIYKKRYISITQSLDENISKNIVYKKPGGGLNLWINMPHGFPVNSLLKYCSSKYIIFAPGSHFYNIAQMKPNNIRLSFASVDCNQIEQGIPKLSEMIDMFNNNHLQYNNLQI